MCSGAPRPIPVVTAAIQATEQGTKCGVFAVARKSTKDLLQMVLRRILGMARSAHHSECGVRHRSEHLMARVVMLLSRQGLFMSKGDALRALFLCARKVAETSRGAPFVILNMNPLWQKNKPASRPCKGQRERYRKHFDRLTEQLQSAPAEFDPEGLDLPPSIQGKLKSKFLGRLTARKNEVLAEGEAGASD